MGGEGGVGGRVKCKTQNIRCLNLHGSEKLFSVRDGGEAGGRVKYKTQNIRCLNLHGSEKLYSVSVLM